MVTFRFWLAGSFALVVGCNALLGNEEGHLVAGTGGAAFASGGVEASAGTGVAGAPANDAGAQGSSEGGAAGGPVASGGSAGSGGTESEAGAAGSVACECTPMTVEMVEVGCGPCELGRQLAPRACRSDCTWSEPAAPPGTCDTTGLCDPAAAPEMRTTPCANGGWKDQKRSCTSDCKVGDWTDTEACQQGPNGCDGCACVSYCDHPERHVTTCLWIACTEAEARAECEEDIDANSCTRRPPVELIDWRPM